MSAFDSVLAKQACYTSAFSTSDPTILHARARWAQIPWVPTNQVQDYVPLTYQTYDSNNNLVTYTWSYQISSDVNAPIKLINRYKKERACDSGSIQLYTSDVATDDVSFTSLRQRNLKIYNLWLCTFIGPPGFDTKQQQRQCEHINQDHFDNTPTNLVWVTRSQNITNRNPISRNANWLLFLAQETQMPVPVGFTQFLPYNRYFDCNARAIEYFTKTRRYRVAGWYILTNKKPNPYDHYIRHRFGNQTFAEHKIVVHLHGDRNDRFQDVSDTSLDVNHVNSGNAAKSINNKHLLELVTHAENMQHAHDSGMIRTNKPILAYTFMNGKISSEPVHRFESQVKAAAVLQLSAKSISEVLNGRQNSTKGYYFTFDAMDDPMDTS